MADLAWVMVGGAVGSGARHLVGVAVLARWGPGFPWATLGVNLLGALLLGVLWSLCDAGTLSPTARVALGTGLLGGFTTYSTFSTEAVRLFAANAPVGALYVAITVIGGLAASWLGLFVGRSLQA